MVDLIQLSFLVEKFKKNYLNRQEMESLIDMSKEWIAVDSHNLQELFPFLLDISFIIETYRLVEDVGIFDHDTPQEYLFSNKLDDLTADISRLIYSQIDLLIDESAQWQDIIRNKLPNLGTFFHNGAQIKLKQYLQENYTFFNQDSPQFFNLLSHERSFSDKFKSMILHTLSLFIPLLNYLEGEKKVIESYKTQYILQYILHKQFININQSIENKHQSLSEERTRLNNRLYAPSLHLFQNQMLSAQINQNKAFITELQNETAKIHELFFAIDAQVNDIIGKQNIMLCKIQACYILAGEINIENNDNEPETDSLEQQLITKMPWLKKDEDIFTYPLMECNISPNHINNALEIIKKQLRISSYFLKQKVFNLNAKECLQNRSRNPLAPFLVLPNILAIFHQNNYPKIMTLCCI
jgi:hypothetical protein